MTRTAFFAGQLPRVIAHRGLATPAPQNSLAAFAAALKAGATHLESDARATEDGHAVLVHDDTLPGTGQVAGTTLADLQRAHPEVVRLSDALDAFPQERFNLDVKSADAVGPTTRALRGHSDRVLVASFSGRRRLAVVNGLDGQVATSASGRGVLTLLAGVRLRRPLLVRGALRSVDAVQLPDRAMRTDRGARAVVAACHGEAVEVHVWTVNDPDRMQALVALGVDGIITDRCDLAARALR